jgi:PAS domain-containing protein
MRDAFAHAHAIVDTVREPLVVSDDELRVVAASRSFYLTFKVNRDETQGRLLSELGDGARDIPKLRLLLGNIIPERGEMEDYEVDHDFPDIGRRTMLLNARKVFYEVGHTRISSCSGSRMSPGSAHWSAKRMSYCGKRTFCWTKSNTP